MQLSVLIKSPKLPSLPEVFIKFNDLVNKNASINEIAVVLSTDTGLTARTLELANSAWFKQQTKINSVEKAVALIGTSALQQLVFATSITRIFQGIDVAVIDMRAFWQQSLNFACYAQSIAKHIGNNDPIRLFTCGILCHTGTLILYITQPNIANDILTKCEERKQPQHVIENEVLGFNHSDISAALFKKWKLPASIYLPIEYYLYPSKTPQQDKFDPMVLNLAQYLLTENGNLSEQVTPFDQETSAALKKSGLSQKDFDDIIHHATELYSQSTSLVGL